MTVTYDPTDPRYFDEADLRGELTRVFDLCHGCRLCYNLCPAFPSLFSAIDGHDGSVTSMTTAEQDRVVDECFGCKLCYVKCPYVPPHEWQLDFPRLMLRSVAVRRRAPRSVPSRLASVPARLADEVLGRTDLLGGLNTRAAPAVNAVTGRPGSVLRKVMERAVGVASQRVLPPYARQRFSTWFKGRQTAAPAQPRATVALFPTCFVEYNTPAIGRDLVEVYEHNGIGCELPSGIGCCGAPWLHAGDFENFTKTAKRNLPLLAHAVRQGRDIVVPQPTCGYVLKRDYADYVGGPDATAVAEHTFDACEYLMRVHRQTPGGLDTTFPGAVPAQVAYQVPCHLQAQNIGLKSRDLLNLTGTKVTVVNKCSGIDGTWGLRAENYELAHRVAQPMADALRAAAELGAEVVAGDCSLANGAILEETGLTPVHPIQVVARAYGIPEPEDG